jgi:hypothetical protein
MKQMKLLALFALTTFAIKGQASVTLSLATDNDFSCVAKLIVETAKLHAGDKNIHPSLLEGEGPTVGSIKSVVGKFMGLASTRFAFSGSTSGKVNISGTIDANISHDEVNQTVSCEFDNSSSCDDDISLFIKDGFHRELLKLKRPHHICGAGSRF